MLSVKLKLHYVYRSFRSCTFFSVLLETMIQAADVIALLAERIRKEDGCRCEGEKRTQEFIEFLCDTIQDFLSAQSFEFDDESTLDHADLLDTSICIGHEQVDTDEDEDVESEEDVDSAEAMEDASYESDQAMDTVDRNEPSPSGFSLAYMKRVLDYYDKVDQNGKRKQLEKCQS